MNDTVQKVLSVTLILVALVVMLRDSAGTSTIIRSLAEGYADAVRALQAR